MQAEVRTKKWDQPREYATLMSGGSPQPLTMGVTVANEIVNMTQNRQHEAIGKHNKDNLPNEPFDLLPCDPGPPPRPPKRQA